MPLKLVKRPNSAFWYIRGSVRGRHITESTGLISKSEAEDVLTLRAAELLAESIHQLANSAALAGASIATAPSSSQHLPGLGTHAHSTSKAAITVENDNGRLDRDGLAVPVRFIKIKRFCELAGYTEAAIHHKISRGVWMQNQEYRRAPDGVILVDLEGFERWVESWRL